MKDIGGLIVRGLPIILLVAGCMVLGARLSEALSVRLEFPSLVIAILAVAGFYLAREARFWKFLFLSTLAFALGMYATTADIFSSGARSWTPPVVGLAIAALVGLLLRPQRGFRVALSLAVAYVVAWLLVAVGITSLALLRSLAALGWLLFVSVGSFVFARAASDGHRADISGLVGDLLIVSANLTVTGVAALGL